MEGFGTGNGKAWWVGGIFRARTPAWVVAHSVGQRNARLEVLHFYLTGVRLLLRACCAAHTAPTGDRSSVLRDMAENPNMKQKIQRQGEEALGKVAKDVLGNPIVTGAVGHVFSAKERATAAQELAMGALNLPTAADIERLTRRVRSVGQRLEGIEDAIDRLDERLARLDAAAAAAATAPKPRAAARKPAAAAKKR